MQKAVLAFVVITLVAVSSRQSFACGSNPAPSVASTVTFAPGATLVIKEKVTNNSSVTEMFTTVVDTFNINGVQIAHHFTSALTFNSGQTRTVSFLESFPGDNTYYTQVGIYDSAGCQRFNQRLNVIQITGPTHVCGSSCVIQYQ